MVFLAGTKSKKKKNWFKIGKWQKKHPKTLLHKNYQLQKYFQESIYELLKNAEIASQINMRGLHLYIKQIKILFRQLRVMRVQRNFQNLEIFKAK